MTHRRRLLARIAACGLAFAAALPAAAQATFEDIRYRKAILVGYRDAASPFSLRDASGRPAGYALEFCAPIVEELKKRTGVGAVRMVKLELPRIASTLRGKGVHLVCTNLSDTPARRNDMAFSAPIFHDGQRVAVKADSAAQTLAGLKGKPVGYVEKSTAEATVKEKAADAAHGWKPRVIDSASAALGQLDLGWVDGVVRDGVALAVQIAESGKPGAYRLLPETLTRETIALAYLEDDAQMAALVDGAMAASIRSGAARGWYDKWFRQPIPPRGRALGVPMSRELAQQFGAN